MPFQNIYIYNFYLFFLIEGGVFKLALASPMFGTIGNL